MYRSDPKLIEACLRNDPRAWDTVVERYQRLVYSIAHRYGMAESDAEDVFQNVFIILFRRLETLRDQTRLSAWLITTTHRECWRVGKRSGNSPGIDEQIVDVGRPSSEQMIAWEQQHLVRESLDRLGGSCRDLLHALFLEEGEASYEIIAERLGMKIGSIGPTRARCFGKLEQILAEMGVEGPAESPESA